jgi:Curli production assembly/transport component CsgG/Flagellar assembly protein T, C-terminal domain
LGVSKSKAVVEVTARMVDVNTGEILASVTGHGESQRNGLTSSGSGFSGWKGGGGQLDMGSTNFSQSILGQAVKQSVNDTAKGLEAHATTLPVNAPAPPAPIDGLVADASGGEIIINVGSSAGVKVGDKLAVTRVLRTVKDPASGKVLRTIDSPIGVLTITSVDSGSAVGKFDGAGTPKVGDAVKRPQ